jgi:hypothetical protein
MSDLTHKICRDCGEAKSASQFWKLASSPDGLAYYCKPCFKQRNAEATMRRAAREGRERPFPKQREELPEGFGRCADCGELKPRSDFPRNKSESSGYAPYCKPCHTAKGVASKTRTHGSTRDYHLKRRYGLNSAEVAAMLAAQQGVCAICLTPNPEHVDHDHKTGKVRAILCFNCNGGLGQFKDRPELLRRGADYLEGNVWKPTLVAPGVYRLPS